MEGAHLHLLLNHFPIIGTLIGIGVLAYGLFINNLSVKKVGLGIFVAMAILALPAYFSGEEAEEAVEHLPGITDAVIHEHEELAEKAILMMALLGALSLFSLYAFWKKKAISKTATIITLLFALITFGVFAKVGNLGGKIRHTELSADTPNQDGVRGHVDDDDD